MIRNVILKILLNNKRSSNINKITKTKTTNSRNKIITVNLYDKTIKANLRHSNKNRS
ncbi:Uncharacterised protein [Mycobacteroides abscessus subsp. abscessus]|nr:Uncharacterised protein [Mycobacteroides abscessus subsp. abscessus]